MLSSSVPDPSVYTDFSGLEKLKQGAREQTPEAINEVAKQFEALFMTQMLKGMRQAKLAEGVMDSHQSEFYRDMYDQQMALHLSGKPGLGMSKLIAQQLGKKSDDEAAAPVGKGLEDYLQRANGVGAVAQPLSRAQTLSAQASSGLERLERTLAKLDQAEKRHEQLWKNLEEDWAATQSNSGSTELSGSKQLFSQQMRPYAEQAAQELGVDVDVLLAQAALETGWGQSVIKNSQGESSFNLFNIKADKAWQGRQARTVTVEYDGGVARKETAGFRSYDSYQQSFSDYVQFLKSNPRYSDALRNAGDAGQYLRELQQAGYATDPHYAQKVMSIYRDLAKG